MDWSSWAAWKLMVLHLPLGAKRRPRTTHSRRKTATAVATAAPSVGPTKVTSSATATARTGVGALASAAATGALMDRQKSSMPRGSPWRVPLLAGLDDTAYEVVFVAEEQVGGRGVGEVGNSKERAEVSFGIQSFKHRGTANRVVGVLEIHSEHERGL